MKSNNAEKFSRAAHFALALGSIIVIIASVYGVVITRLNDDPWGLFVFSATILYGVIQFVINFIYCCIED